MKELVSKDITFLFSQLTEKRDSAPEPSTKKRKTFKDALAEEVSHEANEDDTVTFYNCFAQV